MLPHNMPQLSLVAQYDDLCRHTKSLTEGCEKEFKQYAEIQKRILRRRKEAEKELKDLRERVGILEKGKQKYEAELKYSRKLFLEEKAKVTMLEHEKASMEKIIGLIKDVLLSNGNTIDNQTKERLFQLSSNYRREGGSPSRLPIIEESMGSLLSPSECDESVEDVNIAVTQRKRRSKGKSLNNSSFKKRKSEERAINPCVEDNFGLESDFVAKKSTVKFCSTSELTSDSSETPSTRPVLRSESAYASERKYDLRKKATHNIDSTPTGRYSLGGRGNKPHKFTEKIVIKHENCYPCGHPVKFCSKMLKCGNCRMTCHPHCKDQCPEPCIPVNYTPTRGVTGTLRDFAPSDPPMIPSLIIHCVKQVESTGLKVSGLYRESGRQQDIKDLKARFLTGKSMPSLANVDIHAVCGTIKEFLRSLKDTLITKAAWHTFVKAGNHADEEQSLNMLLSAVYDLPQPNRDTLAFLILHWQKVAASRDCNMPIENIAKVVAPTVVGYSDDQTNMLAETRSICQVMELLLMIPSDSWQNMLSVETDTYHTPMKTPESTPAPVMSRLGPILTSNQKRKNTPVVRTPYKTRTPATGSNVGRRQFFSSPLLK